MNDLNVNKKFGVTDAKDKKEVDGFIEGNNKIVAYLIKNLLLNREAKNVHTLEAMMKEEFETYEEFLDAIEYGMKEKLIKNWRTEGIWRSLVDGCISLSVKPIDLMGCEQLRGFNLEFTAPAMMNEIIMEIIETKLCADIRRVSEFNLYSEEERDEMLREHGMLADASIKWFDGINLEILRGYFQKEMKEVVRDEVILSFQMRSQENARKLITKLKKFKHLEEVVGKEPTKDGVCFTGIGEMIDLENDRNTVFCLLQELKSELEIFKSRCELDAMKMQTKDIIDEVCRGIKYFGKCEFTTERMERLSVVQYLVIIYACYGVFLVEKNKY